MKVCVIAVAVVALAAAQDYSSNNDYRAAGPELKTAAYPQPAYNYAPRPYSFSYEIKDPQSYNDYGHQESSDGKTVAGSYRVALPDGRLQLVNYKADDYGYVADVQYQGEAKYPEYRPQQYVSPAGPAYPVPAGPGPIAAPIPVRGPVALPGPSYVGQGPLREGFAPAHAGAGRQNY